MKNSRFISTTSLAMVAALAFVGALSAQTETPPTPPPVTDPVAPTPPPVTDPLTPEIVAVDTAVITEGVGKVEANLAKKFVVLTGSEDNAKALVTGLRAGGEIKLSTTAADGTVTTTSFTPATSKLGYGNVAVSLALAKESLASQGITEPTAEQLQAALNGGSFTVGEGAEAKTIELPGVLALRSEGKGWGQIAKELDVKVGKVVSELRAGKTPTSATETAARATRTSIDKAARADKPERIEKPAKPERVDRVSKPDRVERPAKPERVERPAKPDRVSAGR